MLMWHFYYYFSAHVSFKYANSTYCLPNKHFSLVNWQSKVGTKLIKNKNSCYQNVETKLIMVLKCKRTKIVFWHIIKKKIKSIRELWKTLIICIITFDINLWIFVQSCSGTFRFPSLCLDHGLTIHGLE